jgi:hypothetical protein
MSAALAYIAAGFVLCVAAGFVWDQFWSFRAQSTGDYAAENPAFDLREHLGGHHTAHGVIFDYSGRVNTRFRATIEGTFDADGGTLDERFVYEGLDTADTRQWQITFTDPRRFTATADDVVGPAEGVLSGNAIRMTYRLRLPERAGGHVLDVVDWLYLMEDGTIVNRSDMRKFGVKAAELFAVFTPSGQEDS